MKILEINAFNYHRGGSETVFFNTASLLSSHGHQVIPFTLRWDDNEPSEYSGYFPESKETRSGVLTPLKNIVNYFYHFEASDKLDQLIRDESPDIAHIHLIWGQLTPSILKVLRRHGIPAILTVHDYRLVCPSFLFRNGRGELCEECEGHRFWKCVTNRCCRGSRGLSAMMAAEQYTRNLLFNPARLLSGLVFVSDFSREIHRRYMPALDTIPSVRLYNVSGDMVDTPYDPADYCLFYGRLSEEKGVRTLISAAALIPDIKIKVAGNGPLADEIRDRCDRENICNIELLGYKKGEELRTLVQKARYVIVPSECYENNPMTIVEAYSAGVPVIGSAIGGIPEIILDGKTGYTFNMGDAADLAATVRRAMSLDPCRHESMRRNALEFAHANFTPEEYYNGLIGFFNEIISRQKQHSKQ